MANKRWREIFGKWVHSVIENGFQRSRLGDGIEVMLILGQLRAVLPHFTLRFHRIGDVAVGVEFADFLLNVAKRMRARRGMGGDLRK